MTTAAVEPTRSKAEPSAEEVEEREPVYVWDLVVRSTHWLIAITLIVLSVTGVYIGRPFLTSMGPANLRFVMGWVKVIHFYAAIVFSLAVGARIIWMFTGTRWARWSELVPTTKQRVLDMYQTFRFYVFLRPSPPLSPGHNPLAGATYVAVFGLYLVMIFTGFALYSVNAHTSYMKLWQVLLPLFGGAATARWLHHVVMWLLIGFAVHHVFSAMLVSRVEKNGTIESIFTGFKFLPRQRNDHEGKGR
jgi:Ni/Fe-hydrogenase 1 B-type cytochrome subunit